MKRILSLALTLVLTLTTLCSTVFADNPKFSANNIEIHKGETITVSFNVTPKSGIAAAEFNLLYDTKAFSYYSHEYGTAFDGGYSLGNNVGDEESDGTGLFIYAFIHAEGIKKGGEMFNVSFQTADAVKVGEKYEFILVCKNCTDKDHNNLEHNKVTVTATVVDGVAPSNTESKTTLETPATQSAEEYLSSVAASQIQNNNGSNNKTDIKLIIVIAVLAAIIIATVITIILIISKRKHSSDKDDDVMTKILSDDADLDLLENDALNDEFIEIEENDEYDE